MNNMEKEREHVSRLKNLNAINEIINDLEHMHNNIINAVNGNREPSGAEYSYYADFDREVQKWLNKFKQDKYAIYEKEHKKLVKV